MTDKLRVLKHSTFGVLALAVAALDFTIGTKHVIIAVYSFAKAASLRKDPSDTENRAKNDDAWQLHYHGANWEDIGTEMRCSPTTARSLAVAYEQRTDTAVRNAQNALF